MAKVMLAMMAAVTAATAVAAAPVTEIAFPKPRIHPESIAIDKAGTLYVGSSADGTVWRAKKSEATASVFIDPAASGLVTILGVYADDRAGLLYVCSMGRRTDPDDVRDKASAIRTFDLKTGAPRGSYQMPGGAKNLCNDFAVGRDGTVYVAETIGGGIVRLKKGASAADAWLYDEGLKGADGIAFDADGKTLYVSSVSTGRIFRTGVKADGSAEPLAELTPSRKFAGADGLRYLSPGKFLISENAATGGIAVVTPKGDTIDVRNLAGGQGGTTSAVPRGGRAWGVVAKLSQRASAEDPGPFTVYSVPLN
jgi:sugar lactone lactonase YvrE